MGLNGPSYTELDEKQVIRQSFDESKDALRTLNIGGNLVPQNYDYIALTYIVSGNGAGQIGTATYKIGGASGTTVAILTLGYDSSNNLISVART